MMNQLNPIRNDRLFVAQNRMPFLEKVRSIIIYHLDDQFFSVEKLAREVSLSVSQLNRRLNAVSCNSAGNLIREIRMNFAVDLLNKKQLSIKEVAMIVGYSNQAHFCRAFKNVYACSPSEYQRSV